MLDYLNSCKSCWNQEGGRCYAGEFSRDKSGRSDKIADHKCELYENKRNVLGKFFAPGMLTIVSEENAKINEQKGQNGEGI